MADSGGGRKRRQPGKRSKDGRQADLIRALNHSLRRRILRLLNDCDEPRSPVQLAKELGVSLSNASYHTTVLKGLGAVTSTGHKPVRGATEHFYVSAVAEDAAVLAMLEATREADEAE